MLSLLSHRGFACSQEFLPKIKLVGRQAALVLKEVESQPWFSLLIVNDDAARVALKRSMVHSQIEQSIKFDTLKWISDYLTGCKSNDKTVD